MTSLPEAIIAGLLASWVALVLHEVGHAMAAWLVGVRIWGIRLGIGPVVWRGEIAGCRIHLAALPLLGSVQLDDTDARAIGYRDLYARAWRFEWGPEAWRAPVISIAGGLSNLIGVLLLVTAWDLLGRPGLGTLPGDLLVFSMWANFAGYLNLLPYFRSDGTHLLAHVRAARTKLNPILST